MGKRLIDKDEAIHLLNLMSIQYMNGVEVTPETSAIVKALHCIADMHEEVMTASLLTEDQIEDNYIPTVIWYEDHEDLCAGVWQSDHYEFEDGSTDEAPQEMEGYQMGRYGSQFRIWYGCEPTEQQRRQTPWH